MHKTFKSVCVPGLELNISPIHQGIALTVTMDEELFESRGITISHEDAASVMLAIAEAAGVSPWDGSVGAIEHGTAEHLSFVLNGLRKYQEAKERATAEAKEQAELKAEALELFRAAFPRLVDEHFLSTEQAELRLRVARRAREKRATE